MPRTISPEVARRYLVLRHLPAPPRSLPAEPASIRDAALRDALNAALEAHREFGGVKKVARLPRSSAP